MRSDERDGFLFDFSSDEIQKGLFPDGGLSSDEIDNFGEDHIAQTASLEDGVEEEFYCFW